MKRRRKPGGAPHERWLVSYADFITLLFAFFVVLYSSSQVDKRKVGQLALAIQTAFQQMGALPASATDVALNPAVSSLSNGSPPNVSTSTAENENLDALRLELLHALGGEIARNEIALRPGADGLVISLHEIAFFDSGSARMRAGSLPAFTRIAKILNEHAYRIRIEGHTDDRAIHNPQFSSNWELSTARATELVRMLITQYGFAPNRLAAAGYAQYHPIASNGTSAGRAQNRRVDIVVLGRLHAAAAMSLPKISP